MRTTGLLVVYGVVNALICWGIPAQGQSVTNAAKAATDLRDDIQTHAKTFLQSLTAEQRKQAVFRFDDEERFDWHYIPRDRKGVPLRAMNAAQKQAALQLLKSSLSQEGYDKARGIMALENVLRVIENRPANDTYRDPDQYAFSVFGDPSGKEPWSWRVDGHHLAMQFLIVAGPSGEGRVLAQTPIFFGSNPAVVRIDGPEKGKQVLKEETMHAFALLASLDTAQVRRATLAAVAYPDIVTGNRRKLSLDRMDGLRMGDMTPTQRALFTDLLKVYMGRYRVTLAKQQLDKLTKAGLDELRFAWAGDLTPTVGAGKGWYYRIHGPTILIEYDNTQTNANHIHTVVRDLTNDFGMDALEEHYRNSLHSKP
ncbi:uncharacterized protein DUF3500 [Spirosoma oryzae]|uniref:Uncharacterized protein DUF3500 n=1 Tax=Spirosoma oryzae TaxID=1469603 RepID=A0A2T0S745_9BACT|nr:uncharacterized protein DUF3500 [Spirosoma oryzae]